MTVDELLDRARVLLSAPPVTDAGDPLPAVEPFLTTRRASLLELARVWSRFGIPLSKLRSFWQHAHTVPHVTLQGI